MTSVNVIPVQIVEDYCLFVKKSGNGCPQVPVRRQVFVYSLGCTLYQMLTVTVPFPLGDTQEKFRTKLQSEPKDARIYNQAIPFDIADLLRSMLTPNHNRRISSAGAVADRLDVWTPPEGFVRGLEFGG
jgi:serine/threonine protein kinase